MILIHSFKSKDGQCANICELKEKLVWKNIFISNSNQNKQQKSDVATFCGN